MIQHAPENLPVLRIAWDTVTPYVPLAESVAVVTGAVTSRGVTMASAQVEKWPTTFSNRTKTAAGSPGATKERALVHAPAGHVCSDCVRVCREILDRRRA